MEVTYLQVGDCDSASVNVANLQFALSESSLRHICRLLLIRVILDDRLHLWLLLVALGLVLHERIN